MTENELSKIVLNSCFKIHKGLGPGLFESVYEQVLCYELTKEGLSIKCQEPVDVIWEDIVMPLSFRADIIVNDKLILELKSVELVKDVHKKQLLTYLKLTEIKLGLLINFNESLLKDGITRIVNGL